ncbi:MAG TPA: Ig-like domain-containing protein [Planctomycetaceae bacterium]|nr:Ig-like domain-containing protein [Planctomycetaceae bacterium]
MEIAFRRPEPSANLRIELTGLDRAVLERLSRVELDRDGWAQILSVSVAGEAGTAPPAMLGDYQVEDGAIVFEPRFPLKAGLTYRAVFDPAALGRAAGTPAGNARSVTAEFALPRPKPPEPASVTAVYPTRDTLPENQLKFYLHFSAPMSRGEAYERIRLLDDKGQQVEQPFLELGEELWDPFGRRFTLFFDPGRIKRGLKPRELFGPALEEGGAYTLVVERDWPDAEGNPLRQPFTKRFKVIAPDDTQPDPSRWKFAAPAAGSRDPLTVTFDEPLDHGMLQRVLVVSDPAGRPVAGRIEVDREETRWRFRPDGDWPSGRLHLIVETTLEDLAGNSIGRPFEVDVVRPIERRIERETVSMPFDVPPRR